MNTAEATVVRIGDDPTLVTVRVDAAVGCARCAAGRGCGAGLTGSGSKSLEIEVPVTVPNSGLSVGDHVQLNLRPGNLLRAALLAYGIPLAGAAIAAAVAFALRATEPVSVTVALAGLVAGMLVSAYRTRRLNCLGKLSPRIEIDSGIRR